MATAQDYADWIVKNADKKGSSEFDTVAKAYQAARSSSPAAAPTPAPSKPFGQQLNDSIADVPRQLGLTARYGLEGAGDALDFVATPFRAGINAVFPNKSRGVEDIIKGTPARPAVEGRSGKVLADMLRLPEPSTAQERVVGDATRMLAGGIVPIGVGAGLVRAATGTTQAVGRVLASNPVQQLVSATAAGAASGGVRESGGNETSQLVASLAAGIGVPMAMNRGASIVGNVAGRLRRGATMPTPQELDVTINNALQGGQEGGVSYGQLSNSVKEGLRQDVKDALKISGSVTPDAVRRLADYRLTGAIPTAGSLTLDPGIVTRQKNTAKLGINSKDEAAQALGNAENANNRTLIENMNRLGAVRMTPDGARPIMNALDARDTRANQLIGDRYNTARTTDGRSALLDHDEFVNRANNLLDENMLGDVLPEGIRNALARDYQKVVRGAPGKMPAGADVGPAQQFGLPVDAAEQIKSNIFRRQKASSDGNERAALGFVRQALDETPLLAGQDMGAQSIDAFNRARALNRSYMNIVERTPALQAVRDGIEPDQFVQKFIVGSGGKANNADVKALYSSIKSDPEAVFAGKQMIASHLKKVALNGAADDVGKFGQSAYNKELEKIGDEKLKLFFPQQELDQLKAIGRVASYEQFQPAGSAVNNSNTASAGLSAIFDKIANSPLLSKIPLGSALANPAQNISVGIRSRQSMNIPEAIAGNRLAAPRGFSVSPLIGTTQDDEEKNALAKQR